MDFEIKDLENILGLDDDRQDAHLKSVQKDTESQGFESILIKSLHSKLFRVAGPSYKKIHF